jgi:hypothetical protein
MVAEQTIEEKLLYLSINLYNVLLHTYVTNHPLLLCCNHFVRHSDNDDIIPVDRRENQSTLKAPKVDQLQPLLQPISMGSGAD